MIITVNSYFEDCKETFYKRGIEALLAFIKIEKEISEVIIFSI